MEYMLLKHANVDVDGTGLRASITCSYNELVEILGEPDVLGSPDNKTQYCWRFSVVEDNGKGVAHPVTLYDYKEYDRDIKHDGRPLTWSIGSKNQEAADLVRWFVKDRLF